MSTTSEYTSGSNFDRLQVQLELNVGRSCSSVQWNAESNASSGISPGSRALDKAFGRVKGDPKMAHHLIPERIWE